LDPGSTHLDADVEVGQDSVIEPGVIMRGKTKVGRHCMVGPFTYLEDAQIGNECEVRFSQLVSCRILERSVIGPFSNIRPESVIGPRARVGNFTEVKASRIGFGSKVNHLSYIGDAEIHEDVNIGAGTITCNFDGERKHATTIGDGAFIGSDTMLVAPVTIGPGARTGAGAVVTKDVPAYTLAAGVPARVIRKLEPSG